MQAILGSTAWKVFYDMGVNDPVADHKDSPWWPVRHYYFLHLSTLLGYIHIELDNIFKYIIDWNETLFTTEQLKDFKNLGIQIKAASKKCGAFLLRGRVYYKTIYDVMDEISKDKKWGRGKKETSLKYVTPRMPTSALGEESRTTENTATLPPQEA